jgi:hypothetical protein
MPRTQKEKQMPANDSGTFDGGYGKPPKHTQFCKGVSGNPKGRPKGRPNIATTLQRILQEKVVIRENGLRRTVTKLEAAMKRLVDKAAGGDIVAIRQLIAVAASAGVETAGEETKARLSESDSRLMNRVLARLRQQPAKDQNDDNDE